MGQTDDLAAIELLAPWTQDRFRADLAGLREDTAEDARRFARQARHLAGLARQVPRLPWDTRGASPWISFTREVAVAASISDRAASARIRFAMRLTGVLPVTLAQLDDGRLPAHRAQAFMRELEGFDDDLAGRIDAVLGERLFRWAPSRIEKEVRAAAARLDAEAVAARAAIKNADRSVQLIPDADDQASVVISGPAVPLVRWHTELDRRARALRASGDPRTLDQLRFDLAAGSYPCAVHVPADLGSPGPVPAPRPAQDPDEDAAVSAFGLRPSFTEAASTDCRRSRPTQANLALPVETSLGLSNEPGWLDGYGWLSAPTCRQLLVDAELRRICVQTGTGQLVDVADSLVRPTPTPTGVRQSVLDMVLDDVTLGRSPTGADPGGPPEDHPAWREEPQHDPSISLARFVRLRDRVCDGPTQSWVPAARAHLDHENAWPNGPTAAWNLAARGERTHLLKHNGWTPLRTPTSTIWISPAGQTIEVDRFQFAPPGIDTDHDGWLGDTALPDPDELHALDIDQLTPRDDGDLPPWVPREERPEPADWVWLHQQLDDNGI